MKILYLVTDDSFFWSHRRPLASAARDAGCEVVVATPPGEYRARIEAEGFRFAPVGMARSRNPVRVLMSFFAVFRLYRRERPDLVHHVSMRPVILGGLAARLAAVPARVDLVTGLGWVFTSGSRWLRFLVERAYRIALGGRRGWTVFQNPDDREHFVSRGLVDPARSSVILGSGVDVERLSARPEPRGTPRVVLAARMLEHKGVGDLVEAGRILRERGVPHRIVLAGRPDEENPASIPAEQLEAWDAEGIVEWVGHREDVEHLLADSHVACLPSYYREGLPKFLLEALALGRPVVTTDMPGCREAVRGGENGILVPPRRPTELADALERLLSDPEARRVMGQASRALARRCFAEPVVVGETLAIYKRQVGSLWPNGEAAGSAR
ncbi:MAG: glycosyltransferase family 4 protein [Planctomycetota bacterium]|nr:glycosyltransferase family 4 protein [Planctomycetota bacterium]